MNRSWTKAEIEILTSAKDKRRIKVPNRSKKSIRRKLISMGLAKPVFKVRFHHKRAWSQDEINLLKSAVDPRKVKIPGRSRQSIVRKATRLKLIKKKPAKRPWKKSAEKLLLKLVKEGKTPTEIVKMGIFNKSRNSIQKKLGHLGLSKKAKINKFPEDILIEFKNFLKENWLGKTPQELTDLWNQKNDFKILKNKVIYHLTVMKIKIPYGEVAIINNLRKDEEKIKKIGANSAKQLDEKLRLNRAEIMRQRIAKKRDLWSGLPLNESEFVDLLESY
jgi:hypothetical protein